MTTGDEFVLILANVLSVTVERDIRAVSFSPVRLNQMITVESLFSVKKIPVTISALLICNQKMREV